VLYKNYLGDQSDSWTSYNDYVTCASENSWLMLLCFEDGWGNGGDGVMLLIRTFGLCTLLLVFNGCTTTRVVMFYESDKYPPTKSVDILSAAPDKPCKAIAILETTGPSNASLPDLLESMRQKAKDIGADAIIPTQDASQRQVRGRLYVPWLGEDSSVSGVVPKIRGVAIKYQ
jgi:hypothetical protein